MAEGFSGLGSGESTRSPEIPVAPQIDQEEFQTIQDALVDAPDNIFEEESQLDQLGEERSRWQELEMQRKEIAPLVIGTEQAIRAESIDTPDGPRYRLQMQLEDEWYRLYFGPGEVVTRKEIAAKVEAKEELQRLYVYKVALQRWKKTGEFQLAVEAGSNEKLAHAYQQRLLFAKLKEKLQSSQGEVPKDTKTIHGAAREFALEVANSEADSVKELLDRWVEEELIQLPGKEQ